MDRMMNAFPPEQFTATQQANVVVMFGLANKALESFERLVELNLEVMKSTLTEAQENSQMALSAKDPQEWLALQAGMMKPISEKVLSYNRRLREIGAAAQAEFTKVTEAQSEAYNRRMLELVDDLASSAPGGSEGAVGALASVIAATNKLYESMYQTATQAGEGAEQNLGTASNTTSKAAKQVVEQASRSAKA
jgi:phasin family protein